MYAFRLVIRFKKKIPFTMLTFFCFIRKFEISFRLDFLSLEFACRQSIFLVWLDKIVDLRYKIYVNVK